jgi:hypothetical protein
LNFAKIKMINFKTLSYQNKEHCRIYVTSYSFPDSSKLNYIFRDFGHGYWCQIQFLIPKFILLYI